jgi:hypothetical protein
MAQSNVAFLSTPEYPQHIRREIARLEEMVSRAFSAAQLSADLSTCDYESLESHAGACDGGHPCHDKATVYHLASDQEYCDRHFREVSRG